jgi:hypothetical protein
MMELNYSLKVTILLLLKRLYGHKLTNSVLDELNFLNSLLPIINNYVGEN